MSRPYGFITRMALFLLAVGAAGVLLGPQLHEAFFANVALNGLILAVIVMGIGLNVRQVLRLGPEIDWIQTYQRNAEALSHHSEPRLLAAMARMLSDQRDRRRFALSALAMRSLLDGIASRLDEARDVSRYFIGLCIFLGLLGTFWGLLETVASIGDVIGDLRVTGDDVALVFNDLKRGLETPLDGMGTAFSSSLFGLAGSLVLGFMDLQASQAQNRFFNELEDWLSGITRLGSAAGPSSETGEQSVPAYLQALLEQTADSLDSLHRTMARNEELRHSSETQLHALADSLSILADQMRSEQQVLLKMAEGQSSLQQFLARLGETVHDGLGIDEATRGHLRSMDLTLSRVADQMAAGREETVREVRAEIRLLARTIAAIAEGGEPPHPHR